MATVKDRGRLRGRRRRALESAVINLKSRLRNSTLLLLPYALFLIGSVVAIFQEIAHYLFLCLIIPLALLAGLQLKVPLSRPEPSFPATLALSRARFRTTVSVILSAAGLYLLMLIISSALQQPTIGVETLTELIVLSLEIVAFLLVTALIVVASKGSLSLCLTLVAVVAAANALAAIIMFAASTPFNQLLYHRLADAAWPPEARLGVASLAINSGIFLAASIAIMLEGTRSLWMRTPLAASALIFVCALFLTQSRSVCFAAAAGIVASCRWSWRLIASVGIAVVLLLGVIFTNLSSVPEVALKRGDSRRLEIWRHYIESTWDGPWLGSGMIEDITFKAKDGLVIIHPHNVILSAEIRGGVLATGAVIVILVGGLYYSARYAQLTGQRAPLSMMVTVVVAGLFDYELIIQSFPSWQTIPFWLPIGICIGTELYVRNRPENGGVWHA